MKDLKATGKLTVNEEEFKRIMTDFAGALCDDEETSKSLKQAYNLRLCNGSAIGGCWAGAYKELEKHPKMASVIQ